jgi:hypothetical protein
VGIRSIEGVLLVCIGITLKVGMAGFIIVRHRRERGFMGEFKGRRAMAEAGEAVNFGFNRFFRVVIWIKGGRGRRMGRGL